MAWRAHTDSRDLQEQQVLLLSDGHRGSNRVIYHLCARSPSHTCPKPQLTATLKKKKIRITLNKSPWAALMSMRAGHTVSRAIGTRLTPPTRPASCSSTQPSSLGQLGAKHRYPQGTGVCDFREMG